MNNDDNDNNNNNSYNNNNKKQYAFPYVTVYIVLILKLFSCGSQHMTNYLKQCT